jgi:poly-gamma-glutamate synthesis protein (capsule biosynthesis protein)
MTTPPTVTLLLAGDVMTGRGIDQILAHPVEPTLYEQWMRSAMGYLDLAEKVNGPISRPASWSYIWGDALAGIARRSPALRIVNLETAVTANDEAWPKGINYRMAPANVPCLTAAGLNCCTLANNHVMDWGEAGLVETLGALEAVGIATAGAGRDWESASMPARFTLASGQRVLVHAAAMPSCGVPADWIAEEQHPGVNIISDTGRALGDVGGRIRRDLRKGDIVSYSVHWGGNWGYEVPSADRVFAHRLIDAGVDLVHGHSSHHPKGIEVYNGRPILYGCGDLINDYEGIAGHEGYRPDLVMIYLVEMDPNLGGLISLDMLPFCIARFRLNTPAATDIARLARTMDRICRPLGTSVEVTAEGTLHLLWR